MAASKKPKEREQLARVVTTSNAIRIETPRSTRGQKQPKVKVLVAPADEMMRNQVGGFVDFLRDNAVVGVAIGFAIGTEAQMVMRQLTASFIDPLFALILNGQLLSQKTAALSFRGQTQEVKWGAFVYTLIDFVFVLIIIYAIVKILRLNKLAKLKT